MIRRISGGPSKRIRLLHKAVVQMYWTLGRQALSYKGYFPERSTTRLIIRFSLHTVTANSVNEAALNRCMGVILSLTRLL